MFIDLNEVTRKVNDQMAEIFDAKGSWYARAGLIVDVETNVPVIDCCPSGVKAYPHILKIRDKYLRIPTQDGLELHPLALIEILKLCLNEGEQPKSGRMDEHLIEVAKARKKKVYALEKIEDRYGNGFLRELREKIEACYDYYDFNCQINFIKENIDILTTLFVSPIPPSYYHSGGIPPEDRSPSVLERNDSWIDNLANLKKAKFNRALACVGCGHLDDLFEKLMKKGIAIDITKISLQELETMFPVNSLTKTSAHTNHKI